MRALDPAARATVELAPPRQVDRHPVGAEQLGDALDRRLERVCERELRDRLADDGRAARGCARARTRACGRARTSAARGRPGRRSSRAGSSSVLVRRPAGRENEAAARRAAAGRAGASRPVPGAPRLRRRLCWARRRSRRLQRLERASAHDRPVASRPTSSVPSRSRHTIAASPPDATAARRATRAGALVVGGDAASASPATSSVAAAVPPRATPSLEQLGESQRARPRAAAIRSPPGRTALRRRGELERPGAVCHLKRQRSSPRRFRRAVPGRPSRRSRATRPAAPRSPRPDRAEVDQTERATRLPPAPAARAPPRRRPTPVRRPPRARRASARAAHQRRATRAACRAPRAPRRRCSAECRSKSEEPLDLAPDRQRQQHADREQPEQHEPEAQRSHDAGRASARSGRGAGPVPEGRHGRRRPDRTAARRRLPESPSQARPCHKCSAPSACFRLASGRTGSSRHRSHERPRHIGHDRQQPPDGDAVAAVGAVVLAVRLAPGARRTPGHRRCRAQHRWSAAVRSALPSDPLSCNAIPA